MKTKNLGRRALLLTFAALLLAVVIGQGLYAGGFQGGYSFEMTPEAIQRTAAGECYDASRVKQDVCAELCLITIDGYAIPQGEFICRPPFS